MIQNKNGGANNTLAPLISFDTLVDTEIGLVRLIYDEYNGTELFDTSFYEQSVFKTVHDLYNRENTNPLTVFANKDHVLYKKIDEYYKEFIETRIKDILKLSITTLIAPMIDNFNNSQEINPTILCYSQDQIDILQGEDYLKDNKKVLLSSLTENDKKKYNQFFLKRVEEIEPFKNLTSKTFYISTFALNFDKEKSSDGNEGFIFKSSDLIDHLIKNRNQISIFDMY